jgi:hypothetical protein
MISEGIAYKKIINCTDIIELRNTRIYLYKIRCKWENKIRNLSSEFGREENCSDKTEYVSLETALAEIVILELWSVIARW